MKLNKASLMIKLLALFAFFMVFLFLNGQIARAEQTTTTQPATANAAPAPATLPPYLIQIGDQFDIKSYFNPELDETVTVRPDGLIALPIVGEIVAVGLTPQQLSAKLTERYASEFKQPEVSVILRNFAAEKVYVAGEVNKPGMVNIVGNLTALQAIAVAEGFKDTASRTDVVIIRRASDKRPVATEVNLKAAIKGQDISQDVLLQPFDVIYVPPSKITDVNRFVQNFIRNNIPIPFTFSYRLDNKSTP